MYLLNGKEYLPNRDAVVPEVEIKVIDDREIRERRKRKEREKERQKEKNLKKERERKEGGKERKEKHFRDIQTWHTHT